MNTESLKFTYSRLEHLVTMIENSKIPQTRAIHKSEYISRYNYLKSYNYPIEKYIEDYAIKLKKESSGL